MVNLVKRPVSDAGSAENIYLHRLVVFVEGQSDVEIFMRLFPDREDEILFRTPSEETDGSKNAQGDGCSAVIKRVAQERGDRSNPDRCIGIVDRDVYFSRREWDVLFESDDDEYRNKCTLGEGIKPLIYWEIENYLLDPEVISAVLSDLSKPTDRIEDNMRIALKCSIYINAANCAIHEHNMDAISDKFKMDIWGSGDFADFIDEECRNRLRDRYEKKRVGTFLERHENIHQGSSSERYFERSMRMAPGKALVSFIRHRYRVRERMDRLLAKQTRSSGKVHDHLIQDIEGGLA